MDNVFDLLQLIEETRLRYDRLDDRFEDGMARTTKEVESLMSAWCVMIQRCHTVVKGIDRRLDAVEGGVVHLLDPQAVESSEPRVLPSVEEFEPDLRDLLDVQSAVTLLRHKIESCNEGLIRRLSRLQA